MSNSVMQNPRLVELLVQRAVDGLNSSERAELKQLLSEENYSDAGRFEYTAASLLLAGDPEATTEEMPEDLRDRLMAQAETFEASMHPPPRQSTSQPRVISIAGRSRSATPQPALLHRQSRRRRASRHLCWARPAGLPPPRVC